MKSKASYAGLLMLASAAVTGTASASTAPDFKNICEITQPNDGATPTTLFIL